MADQNNRVECRMIGGVCACTSGSCVVGLTAPAYALPATATATLPAEKTPAHSANEYERDFAQGWNSCLETVIELNPAARQPTASIVGYVLKTGHGTGFSETLPVAELAHLWRAVSYTGPVVAPADAVPAAGQDVLDVEQILTIVRDFKRLAQVDIGELIEFAHAVRRTDNPLPAVAPADAVRDAREQQLHDAIATVCEGWTLPADARKILETALWSTPKEPAK
jgi:hypothetical protein